MVSRTTDDYQQMALTGCVAVTEPAFWAGWDRSTPTASRTTSASSPSSSRGAPRSTASSTTPGSAMNPKESDNRELSREVLEADPEVPRPADRARHRRDRPQPRHAQRDRHLHRAGRARRRAPPADPDPHAAPRGQAQGHAASRSTCCAAIRELEPERVLVDHAEEHTIEMILDHGFWAGLTLYPQTKISPQRAVDMIERYGPDRICVAGRVRLGPERSDRGAAVRHGDAPAPASRKRSSIGSSSRTRCAFLSQSPKFKLPARRRRRGRRASAEPDTAACASRPETGLLPPHLLHQHPAADGWDAVDANLQRYAPALKARLSPTRRSASGCGCRRATRASCSRATPRRRSAPFSTARGSTSRSSTASRTAPSTHAGQGGRLRAGLARRGAGRYTLDLIDDPWRAAAGRPRRRRLDGAALLQGVDATRRLRGWDASPATSSASPRRSCGVRAAQRRAHPPRHRAGARLRARNSGETIEFFEQWLLPDGGPLLAAAIGLQRGRGRGASARSHPGLLRLLPLRRRVPRIRRRRSSGCERPASRIGRVQLSSALAVTLSRRRGRLPASLAIACGRFADSTYLHQVVERRTARLAPLSRSRRGARRRPAPAGAEWRIHFHVPLFTGDYDGLGSTQDYVRDGARHRRAARSFTTHLEIETYTWDVLPAGLEDRSARVDRARVRLGASTAVSGSGAWRAADDAQDRRPQRRRPDAGTARRRNAEACRRWASGARVARIKPAFPAVTCTAQSDYLTGHYPGIPRHRRQRLVRARRLRRSGSGSSRTGWCRRRRSGTRREPSIRRSRARTCSGGSTCIRRRTTPSRRGRCIRPTGGRSRTSTPRRPGCATSCRRSSGRFRCSSSGDRARRIRSTAWIAERPDTSTRSSIPTLTLVYLPHLDYNLQRVGPRSGGSGAISARSTSVRPI